MTGTFAYLTVCSIRNNVRQRIRRLRQPRYLLIALGAVLYVGSMTLGRPRSGTLSMFVADVALARMVAAGGATLMLGIAWVLPGVALQFTSAEIQFLLTAPIPRRQVIAYKVWRLLLNAAGTGTFLTILIGPTRLVPAILFAAKSAIAFAILTLNGAGVAMYRGRAKEQGHLRARWRVVAAVCLLTPILGAGLAFLVFSSGLELMAALPVALLVTGGIARWIIHSDHAFEEAATDAAEKLSRAKASAPFSTLRVSARRTTPFRLASRGPAESAILWKNWLLLGRTSRRTFVMLAIVFGVLIIGFAVASGGAFGADAIGNISLLFVGLAVLMGPAMLRIDLRQDLAHLALIKTWPVRGPSVIRGEIMAPAIALSLFATAAVVIGSVFAPDLLFVDHPAARARVAFAISAVLVVTAIIVAQLVVHNAIAVSFPAWVELKVAGGGASMDMNARMMIVMYGAMLILAFVLVLPAAAAAAAYYVTRGLLIPSAIFAVLLHGESLAATEVVGRILDRTDLQDVVVTE